VSHRFPKSPRSRLPLQQHPFTFDGSEGWQCSDKGTCQKAGVPASACGVGFLPDGKDGCEPILPADPCPEGLMAIPGDTECHEVASCGSGAWGDIPVEASTQFVDKSYAGGDSNGTQAKPWTSIQQGVNAATNGAIVAVAAGSYPEDVLIQAKAVRLWGRCPTMVEVMGTGAKLGAIQVYKSAGGAEIHGVAVTGAKVGILVLGSSDVVIDSVWIHGMGDRGIGVEDTLGLTDVMIRGSLVEQNHDIGVYVSGSNVTIETTVIRSTLPNALGKSGRGINIRNGPDTNARANVTVRACVVEQNQELGVHVAESDVTIETAVVRSTLPNAQGTGGRGINIQQDAKVMIKACVVEQNHEIGVFVAGSDATIEAAVVRSTLPNAQGDLGRGIHIHDDPDAKARANVTVRACLVEQNHDSGVFVSGSDATIEATVVRSTLPDALGDSGIGIAIHDGLATQARANGTVRACLVELNQGVGVFVSASDATIEATVVRSTLPDAHRDGRAFAGVSVRSVGGAPGDGADDAGGGEGGGGAGVNATVSASLHGEDFFGLARPSGGFGVTSARHKERAAKTPWSRTSGK
jgi:hypothetical protein